jgi:hypothetical protein
VVVVCLHDEGFLWWKLSTCRHGFLLLFIVSISVKDAVWNTLVVVQELENLTRDQLQKHNYSVYAGSVHNGTTLAGSQYPGGQTMYGGSVYNQGSMYQQNGFAPQGMYAGSMVKNSIYQVCLVCTQLLSSLKAI